MSAHVKRLSVRIREFPVGTRRRCSSRTSPAAPQPRLVAELPLHLVRKGGIERHAA